MPNHHLFLKSSVGLKRRVINLILEYLHIVLSIQIRYTKLYTLTELKNMEATVIKNGFQSKGIAHAH
jgi:hypothetical protein